MDAICIALQEDSILTQGVGRKEKGVCVRVRVCVYECVCV